MALQLNNFADPEVDKLLLQHNNRPMKALYEALKIKSNEGIELPMAIIMDRRCGIERKAEEVDVPRYIVGVTPIMLAVYAGRVDVAKALLVAGADPNAKDPTGENSLMAAGHIGNFGAIELLVSYGADINAVDEEGNTSLHYAASLGNASAIELLEQAGPDPEAVNNKGCAPLHNAASNHRVGTIEVLLKLGANQAAVDNEGRTSLHCAAVSLFDSVDVIEAFRYNVAAFEANLRAVDKNGQTPRQCRPSSYESKITDLLSPK